MPKKPSAISFTPDAKTILVADKFGDVYALPLLMSTKSDLLIGGPGHNAAEAKSAIPEPRTYKPAATNFTVHTKRNRQALENQLKSRQSAPEKKTLNFKYQLLLGHVSLLTDLTCAEFGVDGRYVIITADRDEHIRVSRGIPQTHIIEGFCLGHTNFVNKLLVPGLDCRSELLISGGGDDYVLVWNWRDGQVIAKVDLRQYVDEVKRDYITSPNKIDLAAASSATNYSSFQEDVFITIEGYAVSVK